MHVRPATIDDLVNLIAPRPGLTVPMVSYRAWHVQVTNSDAWVALRSDGTPVALGGVFLFGDRPSEAWLLVQAGGLGGDLLPIVVRARRHLRQQIAVHGLICRVRVGNREGARLACALGFLASGVVHDGMQTWRFDHERRDRRAVRGRRQQQRGATANTGHAATAG